MTQGTNRILLFYMIPDEPRWERESVITLSKSIELVVEAVSTNWRDDYLVKLADYEAFGIQEYWIIDYLGIGAILAHLNNQRLRFVP